MRRLIFRPLVLILTFLLGLFVTSLLTFTGDGLARLLYEPSETIPAVCLRVSDSEPASCSQPDLHESDEAAVYSALIEQTPVNVPGRASTLAQVVIQDRTVRGDHLLITTSEYGSLDRMFEALKRDFPLAEQATLDSFRAVNDQSYPILKHPFLIRTRIRLISWEEVERFSTTNPGVWWDTFYRQNPGAKGFLLLSKVGFNQGMNQAIVYRAFSCGSTCGYGSYVLLVKEDGVWRIRAQAGQWMS